MPNIHLGRCHNHVYHDPKILMYNSIHFAFRGLQANLFGLVPYIQKSYKVEIHIKMRELLSRLLVVQYLVTS